MQQIILDAEAGQISAELTRRGIAPDARVHAVVELRDDGDPPGESCMADPARAFLRIRTGTLPGKRWAVGDTRRPALAV